MPRIIFTQERVKELFHYDPETGVFTWRVNIYGGRNNAFVMAKAGDVAGGIGGADYWCLTFDKRRVGAHRVAWVYMTGELPEHDVDHENGNRIDNRWHNLRKVTRGQNMQNLKGAHKDNSTGLLGVMRHRDNYQARIMKDGIKHYLGDFDTAESAHKAYLAAKRQLHEMGTL